MRNFLKGDLSLFKTAAYRITGSTDIYDPASRGHKASVNFLNCHDGFTLWDMYTYSRKHNKANGWNDTDGSDDNRSWNCGVWRCVIRQKQHPWRSWLITCRILSRH